MKPFIHDDFLLDTPAARELYHGHAAGMPIIDYHCHLPPQDIAQDKRWDTITQIWLGGDHYKWRTLRSNGVDENYITGNASDREKFSKFAETMPYLLRNPVFDWSHLELARYFGITDLLSPATADAIYKQTNAALANPEFSARGLMLRSNVRLVCTTDDPIDPLTDHLSIRDSGFSVKVLPTWRPDKALGIERTSFWNTWVDKLADVAGTEIHSFDDFMNALQKRHDFFHAAGCRISDYGLDKVHAVDYTEAEIRTIFKTARAGGSVSASETSQFKSAMLYLCGKMDAASDWAWQIHYGVMRNNNTRMFGAIGADTGFDSIGDYSCSGEMSKLFDRLDSEDALPRTVIYPINPGHNEVIATLIGNFQRGPVAGKMQFGSGWWFNDQHDGMLRQMESLSQLGLLSRFVGMLTDSRSFLSYTRHEYFRRILCAKLGAEITEGRLPNDIAWTGQIVKDICFNNANRYFGFNLPA